MEQKIIPTHPPQGKLPKVPTLEKLAFLRLLGIRMAETPGLTLEAFKEELRAIWVDAKAKGVRPAQHGKPA